MDPESAARLLAFLLAGDLADVVVDAPQVEEWAAPLPRQLLSHHQIAVGLVGGALVQPHERSGLQLQVLVLVVFRDGFGLLGLADHQLSSHPLGDLVHLLIVGVHILVFQRPGPLSGWRQHPWVAGVDSEV